MRPRGDRGVASSRRTMPVIAVPSAASVHATSLSNVQSLWESSTCTKVTAVLQAGRQVREKRYAAAQFMPARRHAIQRAMPYSLRQSAGGAGAASHRRNHASMRLRPSTQRVSSTLAGALPKEKAAEDGARIRRIWCPATACAS